jgi:hypothetical protein
MHTLATAAYALCLSSAGSERDLALCRRGLALAQNSGNRYTEAILATALARLEAEPVVTVASLDHLRLVIQRWHDSGNFGISSAPSRC